MRRSREGRGRKRLVARYKYRARATPTTSGARDGHAGAARQSGRPTATGPQPARRPGPGDPGIPHRGGLPDRRSSRSQPRGGGAHPRRAPGLRLPADPDRVRHRPPGLRAQAAHRPPRRLRGAAHPRRTLGVPEPRGVGARRRRELARVHGAVLRRRDHPRLGGRRRAGAADRRRRRRRRADRRPGLGGAEQPRPLLPTGRRGAQRQRPVLRAHRRRPAAAPEPGRRPSGVRRPASPPRRGHARAEHVVRRPHRSTATTWQPSRSCSPRPEPTTGRSSCTA
jgi:hypothetical protein